MGEELVSRFLSGDLELSIDYCYSLLELSVCYVPGQVLMAWLSRDQKLVK